MRGVIDGGATRGIRVSSTILSARRLWQRVRTPYGSFLALTAIVAVLMARVGSHLLMAVFCVLLLFAWCFYGLAFLAAQDAKRQMESLRFSLRQIFIVTACVAVIVGALVNHWPFRWRFALSLQELDQFADRIDGGLEIEKPKAVGLFVIEKAEVRTIGGKRVPCLWTDPDTAGPTGFVRCMPEQAHRFNLWSTERMNDRWQLIIED